MSHNNNLMVTERRQKIWTFLLKGLKGFEIAKILGVNASTVSRDIAYLTTQSQNYLEDLAKKTLPFMYQVSIESIREVIKEAWSIYNAEDANYLQKLMALRLIRESNEAQFKLLSEGPSIIYVQSLEEKLTQIETHLQQQPQLITANQISR
jgi:transcriptional regulator